MGPTGLQEMKKMHELNMFSFHSTHGYRRISQWSAETAVVCGNNQSTDCHKEVFIARRTDRPDL